MLQLSDSTFMSLFRAGDKEAFKLIFDSHYKVIVLWALNKYNRSIDAETIESSVLDIFLKVYLNRERYNDVSHIRRSLFIMTKNKMIDTWDMKTRALKRGGVFSFDPMLEEGYIENAVDYISYEGEKETIINSIGEAINKLPNKQREIIKRLFYCYQSSEEIACQMNIKPQTVRNVKIKALGNLKRMINYDIFI